MAIAEIFILLFILYWFIIV